jgi:hypothetical protein
MQSKYPYLPIMHIAVTGVTIAVPAGAAGTVKEVPIGYAPILDSNGTKIGANGATSVVLTSSTFDNEVAYKTADADLANGDYWVDYVNGILRGKKKDTGTSLTSVALKTYKLNVLTA